MHCTFTCCRKYCKEAQQYVIGNFYFPTIEYIYISKLNILCCYIPSDSSGWSMTGVLVPLLAWGQQILYREQQ